MICLAEPDPRALNDEERERASDPAALAMALAVAARWSRKLPFLAEEFESRAWYAVARASRTFDPYRNDNFPLFAARRARGAMLDACRAERKLGYGRSCGYRGAPAVAHFGAMEDFDPAGPEAGPDDEEARPPDPFDFADPPRPSRGAGHRTFTAPADPAGVAAWRARVRAVREGKPRGWRMAATGGGRRAVTPAAGQRELF